MSKYITILGVLSIALSASAKEKPEDSRKNALEFLDNIATTAEIARTAMNKGQVSAACFALKTDHVYAFGSAAQAYQQRIQTSWSLRKQTPLPIDVDQEKQLLLCRFDMLQTFCGQINGWDENMMTQNKAQLVQPKGCVDRVGLNLPDSNGAFAAQALIIKIEAERLIKAIHLQP